jgi:hypothetical protein
MTMGDSTLVTTALEGILAVGPAFEQLKSPMSPIQLTPHAPYVMGRAALVFGSPYLLSPADDVAEFGSGFFSGRAGWEHYGPYPDARVVVWFKPPALGRAYSIDFTCRGQQGHSLSLVSSKGDRETNNVCPHVESDLQETSIGTNYVPRDNDWVSFTLSSGGHWKFLSVDIRQLVS